MVTAFILFYCPHKWQLSFLQSPLLLNFVSLWYVGKVTILLLGLNDFLSTLSQFSKATFAGREYVMKAPFITVPIFYWSLLLMSIDSLTQVLSRGFWPTFMTVCPKQKRSISTFNTLSSPSCWSLLEPPTYNSSLACQSRVTLCLHHLAKLDVVIEVTYAKEWWKLVKKEATLHQPLQLIKNVCGATPSSENCFQREVLILDSLIFSSGSIQ